MAKLKWELRGTQDALDLLKKTISIMWKQLKPIYLEISENTEKVNNQNSKEAMEVRIKDIYDNSKQNYGAPTKQAKCRLV